MALPIYTKAGATGSPLTLDRGVAVPYHDANYTPNQSTVRTRGGQLRTAEWNTTDVQYMEVKHLGITAAKRDALVAFFSHAHVRWGMYTFTFQPEGAAGTSYTARLAIEKMGEVDWPTIRGMGRCDVILILEIL